MILIPKSLLTNQFGPLLNSASVSRYYNHFKSYVCSTQKSIILANSLCKCISMRHGLKKIWYPLAKTLAEQAAWKFCEENGIDLVTVLPSFLVGPSLPPDLCSTASDVLGLLKGTTDSLGNHHRKP